MNNYKAKALIVDDEEHIRDLLNLILTYLGFEIIGKAADGEEAIALFKEHKPDLILLDISMPLKTGDEVLKSIQGQYKDTCIIMLTSVSDLETVKTFLNLGISYFIRKDTPMSKMMDLIKDTWESFKQKRKKTSIIMLDDDGMVIEKNIKSDF